MFARFFKRDETRKAGARLYDAVVDQARTPAFYADLGVGDHLEGRFDLLVLHVHLVVRRLTTSGEPAAAGVAQALFDTFFHDMDRTLRAMGVGDMSVGKKVKDMVRAYYGRCASYEAALAEGGDLQDALFRNVYAGAGRPDDATALAGYVRRAEAGIAGLPTEALVQGEIRFPAVEEKR